MAEVIVYDPSMLFWLDESGCDRRHTIRKYGYSLRDNGLAISGILSLVYFIRGIVYP